MPFVSFYSFRTAHLLDTHIQCDLYKPDKSGNIKNNSLNLSVWLVQLVKASTHLCKGSNLGADKLDSDFHPLGFYEEQMARTGWWPLLKTVKLKHAAYAASGAHYLTWCPGS